MKSEIEKMLKLVFFFAFGLTIYYGYSSIQGSRQMASYDVSYKENEYLIKQLDSVLAIVGERTAGEADEEQINQLAENRELAYQMRKRIKNYKEIGGGVYTRRLRKFYLGFGATVLLTAGILFLRLKK